jgi:quinol-cytochrome oxidoreductase complex cytochrome b subunit
MRFLYLAAIIWVVVTVFATVYAAATPGKEMRVLGKVSWLLLILFVPLIGAVLYFAIGRPVGGTGEKRSRNLAPDDDPEFLRKLRESIEKEQNDDTNE